MLVLLFIMIKRGLVLILMFSLLSGDFARAADIEFSIKTDKEAYQIGEKVLLEQEEKINFTTTTSLPIVSGGDNDCGDGGCSVDGVLAEISKDGENTILALSFTENNTLSLDAQLVFDPGAFNASYENLKSWMCAYNPGNGKIACANAEPVGRGNFGRYVIAPIGGAGIYDSEFIVSSRGTDAGNLVINKGLNFQIEIPERRNLPINYMPSDPYLSADSSDDGGVLLRWSRSDLVKEEITGKMILGLLSKRLEINQKKLEANQITGNVGFVDSIMGFFKTLFGAEGVETDLEDYDEVMYNIYRNGIKIAEVNDNECLMEYCGYTDMVNTGSYEYYIEACYTNNCKKSNKAVVNVVLTGLPAIPGRSIPGTESPSSDVGWAGGVTTTTINVITTTTTVPGMLVNTCSSSPNGVCPAGCAAGSDYDCCIAKGYCWGEGQGCYSTC